MVRVRVVGSGLGLGLGTRTHECTHAHKPPQTRARAHKSTHTRTHSVRRADTIKWREDHADDPATANPDGAEDEDGTDPHSQSADAASKAAAKAATAAAIAAGERRRRQRLLAGGLHEEEARGGMVDVFKVLGKDLDPLRNRHATADRLLTLLSGGGDDHLQRQKALATRIQRMWRGKKAREQAELLRASRDEDMQKREEERRRGDAKRREEEAAAAARRQRLALLGAGGAEPYRYPWDDRFPTNAQVRCGMQSATVLIYVSAYVGQIKSGNKGAGTFLVLANTSWRNSEQILNTAMSMDEFTAAVRELPFRDRVVVLDVVHAPFPVDDSRFRSRVLYPPPDLYAMVSRDAEAVVLGSCLLGTSVDKSGGSRAETKMEFCTYFLTSTHFFP